MKLRLFWTMLIAFVLVIVLGVAGMVGSFGLVWALIGRPRAVGEAGYERMRQAYIDSLADYYTAHGDSWQGIDRRLGDLTVYGPALNPVLADAKGQVVAGDGEIVPGMQLSPPILARGQAIRVRGRVVGTLLLGIRPGVIDGRERPAPPPVVSLLLRGMIAAGFGLGMVLLGLAVVFAGRMSRPLRRLTAAAQALAAGQLDVQVPGATVRELDELSSAFNSMARALADADRQRRQMTADIAHELRTPLSIIKGRLMGMQDGIYSATPDQVLRLLDATALLERLIDDLRLLALAEAGQLPLHREVFSAHDLLDDTQAAFAEQAAEREVQLLVEADDDLPPLLADPQRIMQVLANLVANALRHTPPGGQIRLQAESGAPNEVRLAVADSGSGIDPGDLPHVFERFYRADRARTRGAGAGLGLAISRQIVLAHGGSIEAASTPGQGTTISLSLPSATAAPLALAS